MCFFSTPDVDTPAAPQLVPNLPPNVLRLSTGAREQLAGEGRGLGSLRIPLNPGEVNSGSNERLKINIGGE